MAASAKPQSGFPIGTVLIVLAVLVLLYFGYGYVAGRAAANQQAKDQAAYNAAVTQAQQGPGSTSGPVSGVGTSSADALGFLSSLPSLSNMLGSVTAGGTIVPSTFLGVSTPTPPAASPANPTKTTP